MNAHELVQQIIEAKKNDRDWRTIGPTIRLTCTFEMARLALFASQQLVEAGVGVYDYSAIADQWAHVMVRAFNDYTNAVDINLPLGTLFETLGCLGGYVIAVDSEGYDNGPVLAVAHGFYEAFTAHTGIDVRELLDAMATMTKE